MSDSTDKTAIMLIAISRAIADAKEFVEASEADGFDPNDALDLIREFAMLPVLPEASS